MRCESRYAPGIRTSSASPNRDQHARAAPGSVAWHTDNIGNIDTMSTMHHVDSDVYDYPDDDFYPDTEELYGPVDHRWRPVAVIAGVVFVLAVIASVVIANGGDSASTSATVAPPTRTVIATPRPTSPTAPPSPSLSPETVTTVTPPPRQPIGPVETPNALPPPEAGPAPEVNPRTFVYRVTGTKQLLDLVSVVYTDAQGMPHTDVNVSLPWSKTVVLDPGVELKSVIATSLTGRLNCAITDAAGQPVVVSASNSIIATCTR